MFNAANQQNNHQQPIFAKFLVRWFKFSIEKTQLANTAMNRPRKSLKIIRIMHEIACSIECDTVHCITKHLTCGNYQAIETFGDKLTHSKLTVSYYKFPYYGSNQVISPEPSDLAITRQIPHNGSVELWFVRSRMRG